MNSILQRFCVTTGSYVVGQSRRQGTHRRPRRLRQGTISKALPNLPRPALRGKRARSGLRGAAPGLFADVGLRRSIVADHCLLRLRLAVTFRQIVRIGHQLPTGR